MGDPGPLGLPGLPGPKGEATSVGVDGPVVWPGGRGLVATVVDDVPGEVVAVVVVEVEVVVESVVVGPVAAQLASVKVSLSSVTAPVLARTRPWTVTLLLTVIEMWASTVPTNSEPEPRVADDPTCQ